MSRKMVRNSRGLRDVLFDEIDQLRNGDGDPTRALAVANLAKQIINTVKVELDYHREATRLQEQGNPLNLGTVPLGSTSANAAERDATAPRGNTTSEAGASLQS